MADQISDNALILNQPETPSYLQMDPKDRDGFLFQLGTIADHPRILFSEICDLLEPEISFKKLVSLLEGKVPSVAETLESLMEFLQAGRCGILEKSISNGRLENSRVILTGVNSPRFWYWLIENTWKNIKLSGAEPFPTVEDFGKKHKLPVELLQQLPLTDITTDLVNTYKNSVVIFKIDTGKNCSIIITPASLPVMMDVSRVRIRQTIQKDSSLQSAVSRMMGVLETAFKQSIARDEHDFWNRLTNTLIENRTRLAEEKITTSIELFRSARIIRAFTENQMTEMESMRKDEEEKLSVMKKLLLSIAKKDGFLVERKDFNDLFKPYEEKWEDIRQVFDERFLKSNTKSGLPAVILLDNKYIYRDNVYLLFKTEHDVVSSELRKYYLKQFSLVLRSNNRKKASVFSTLRVFRTEVKQRIAENYQVMNSLYSSPRLVADGIIHYGTKVLKNTEMQRLRSVLDKYFVPGSVKFKEIDDLFNLHLSQIFEQTFSQLSLIRRFLMRVSGQYENYLNRYSPLNQDSEREVIQEEKKTPRKARKPVKTRTARKTRKPASVKKTMKREEVITGRNGNKQRNQKIPRQGKILTREQQEKAWSELNDLTDKRK